MNASSTNPGCAPYQPLLSPSLDGALSPKEQDALDRHLASCAECRAARTRLQTTVALLRPIPSLIAWGGLVAGIWLAVTAWVLFPALRRWVQCHWWGYLRARWLEHLQGKRFWVELDRGDFGLLQRTFHDDSLLLDRILDRLKSGQENLHIITWALDWGIPTDRVLRILEALDINSRRLAHRFDPQP